MDTCQSATQRRRRLVAVLLTAAATLSVVATTHTPVLADTTGQVTGFMHVPAGLETTSVCITGYALSPVGDAPPTPAPYGLRDRPDRWSQTLGDRMFYIGPERDVVYRGGSREVIVEVEVKAKRPAESYRSPVNLSIVLDRSGFRLGQASAASAVSAAASASPR